MPVTWDSSFKDSSVALSGSDLIATTTTNGENRVRATQSYNSGKRCFEIELTNYVFSYSYESPTYILLLSSSATLPDEFYPYFRIRIGDYGVKVNDSSYIVDQDWYTYPSLSDGVIIRVAVDFDAGKIWFGIGNNWSDDNAGDPSAGTGASFTTLSGLFYPALDLPYDTGAIATVHFKAEDFTYSIPSGFSAWEASVEPTFTYISGSADINLTISGIIDKGFDPRSLKNCIYDHLLRSSVWSKPYSLYLGLLSSLDPVIEISDGAYSRIELLLGNASWLQTNNVFSNQDILSFPSFNGTLLGVGIFNHATDGVCLLKQSFGSARIIAIEQPGPYFPIGALSLTIF